MTDDETPNDHDTISDGLVVEYYDDHIRIIEQKPETFVPESVELYDMEIDALVNLLTEHRDSLWYNTTD